MTQVQVEQKVPRWVSRPLPVNALRSPDELAQVDQLAAGLPESLWLLGRELNKLAGTLAYDACVNRANAHVWLRRGDCLREAPGLISYVVAHFPPRARLRILRRIAKSPRNASRRAVERLYQQGQVREVGLPRDDTPEAEWDASGWFAGLEPGRLYRPRGGRPLAAGLPQLNTIGAVRRELGIRSAKQLGWLLLATDQGNGPYECFQLAKRQVNAERTICAPKWQLRKIQQLLLRKLLEHVPVHPAAHGFVRGRSTVTNAQPHVGKPLILKFDLQDFFPTIHYYRVVGLYTSLGYSLVTGRFSASDSSQDVAPMLARLCTYTSQPRAFGEGHLPQGAPTSPAISNLVCRRLDARLWGLARANRAAYTRYADDLTFSFADPELPIGRFRWWVDQICHQEGFLVNQGKFRAIRRSQRQSVTGITVNDCLRVPRRQRRKFRAMLHNCHRNGVEAECRKHPGLASYLRGFASYLNMVHPEEGARVLREVRELFSERAADE